MTESSEPSATILVVDDESSVRRAISQTLRVHGYEVIEATDGEDALVAVGEFRAPVHLVISDVVMPRLGGVGLFAQLREWYPHIRFLLISGDLTAPERVRELGEHRTRFLAKPFAFDQMVAAVQDLLDA